MSAIEQPAARSGRITCWSGPVRISADSAMKWTPQKTMNSASVRAPASRASLNESPVTSANWITSSGWYWWPSTKTRSPRASLAARARATRSGSDAAGRSPGHSTPRSASRSRPLPRGRSGRSTRLIPSSYEGARTAHPGCHASAMSRRGEVLALVQAGGQGSRMDVLTRERAKPALPYGGVHRLVDFALSGLVHADLADVWVSLEYQVTSIDDYLSGGRPWSLDRNRGGFRRIVPQTGTGPATESGFAHGNGDLLLRMSADIETFGARTLAVCSADHVFNMDLAPVIEEHVSAGRVATVLTSEVTKKDAADNVVVLAGSDGTVTGVEHKPSRPSAGTVAPEIFLYDTEVLLATLRDLRRELSAEVDDDDSGIGDFGEHLLPRLVETGRTVAVPLTGYWRDVGQ